MIRDNLQRIQASLPASARLIAVSKTKPVEMLREAYDAGQRLFGENKALEMRDKHAVLPTDIEWHFIGHLQRNKIKYIVPFVRLIHSVDSLELLVAIDKEAAKHDRVVDCLLEFHIAEEDTKNGLSFEEARDLLESTEYRSLTHVRLCGVMGMATHTDDAEQIHREFRSLHSILTTLKSAYFADADYFRECSMGMSGDYPIALEEGATLVRVGSSIFGARDYGVPIND